jgi:kynurenine formamidase
VNQPISRRTWLVSAAAWAAVSHEARAAQPQYPKNLTSADIEKWMEELSNWGKWGKDDQLGTLNLITAAKRKAALALAKEGTGVSMALDADLPPEGSTGGPLPSQAPGGPRGGGGGAGTRGGVGGGPRSTWTLTSRPPGPDPRPQPAYVVDTIAVSYHGNNSTHIDAPSHMYYKGQIYNGYPQTSYTDRGAGKDDVMGMKNGILTRGVLFDIPKLKNVPYLGDTEAIYPEDLEAWEKKAGFRVESGDAVLVRTGRWVRVKEKGPLNLNQAAPGMYASCAKWLRERGAALLGSDVVQDVRPSQVEGVNQPIHQLALWAMGMPLIDNADLDALSEATAQHRRWTYLLTINPLRVPGATGGPVNPIAVF